MTSSFFTLVWLQWKRFRSNVAYGLSLIGFERGTNPIYQLYIGIFWLVWLGMMWVFAVEQVYQISLLFSSDEVVELQIVVPPLIFVAQLYYLITVLRNSPVKLGSGDIVYVAASPINRAAIVFIHFTRSLLLPAFIIGVVACWVAMLLTWPLSPERVGFAGLQGMVLGWAIFLFTAVLCWIIAILKMTLVRSWLMWVVVPIVFALSLVFPVVVFYPAHLWLTSVNAGMTIQSIMFLLVLTGIALYMLAVVSNRVNMIKVVADSWTYARIQKLGIFARMYSDDVIISVQRQAQLLRKKRLRLTISERAVGYGVIWNRALLSLFRFAPGSLLRLVLRGMTLTATATLIIRISGGQHLQTWLLLLMVFIFLRPLELNTLFQQDAGQVFTRQFLPSNLLWIVLADSLIPILLASIGGLIVLVFLPWLDSLTAIVLIFSLFVGLEFCQALERITVPRPIFRPIPYAYSVVFTGLVLIAVGYLFKDSFAVVIAALSLNLLFASAIYRGSLRGN